MKIARIVVGILTFVFCAVIVFQSGLLTYALIVDELTDSSAMKGFIVALLMLAGGLIAIVGRNSKRATDTASYFYVVAAIVGFFARGYYIDLPYWGILSFCIAIFYWIASYKMGGAVKVQDAEDDED